MPELELHIGEIHEGPGVARGDAGSLLEEILGLLKGREGLHRHGPAIVASQPRGLLLSGTYVHEYLPALDVRFVRLLGALDALGDDCLIASAWPRVNLREGVRLVDPVAAGLRMDLRRESLVVQRDCFLVPIQ